MLTLGAPAADAAPKHRHHQAETATTRQEEPSRQGIEAFSDTTATTITEANDTVIEDNGYAAIDDGDAYASGYGDDDDELSPIGEWGKYIGWGMRGILLAIVVVVLLFLLCLSPIIVLILLLRYLIVRHNDRVKLAEQAMATGQPVPEAIKPAERQTDEYQWKRGVRNTAIGIGLMLMFGIWGSAGLVGIGALITCYGVGQIVIAKTTKGDNANNPQE